VSGRRKLNNVLHFSNKSSIARKECSRAKIHVRGDVVLEKAFC